MEGKREAPCDLIVTDPGTRYVSIYLLIRGARSRLQAIVDPVADGNTGRDQHTLDHDQLTALVRFGGLGLPHGHSTGVHSVAPASDQSTNTTTL